VKASPAARRFIRKRATELEEDGLSKKDAIGKAWSEARERGMRTGPKPNGGGMLRNGASHD
jgi:hypothetical protein